MSLMEEHGDLSWLPLALSSTASLVHLKLWDFASSSSRGNLLPAISRPLSRLQVGRCCQRARKGSGFVYFAQSEKEARVNVYRVYHCKIATVQHGLSSESNSSPLTHTTA
jgi:hypothetical protein